MHRQRICDVSLHQEAASVTFQLFFGGHNTYTLAFTAATRLQHEQTRLRVVHTSVHLRKKRFVVRLASE